MKNNKRILIGIIASAFLVLFSVTTTHAQFNFGAGNGNIIQSNNGSQTSSVSTNCDTGSNNNSAGVVGGQSIGSGDCSSSSVVTNQVNTNIYTCCSPTPTKGPSVTPDNPTPTNPPSNGGGGNGGSSNGGGGGGADSQQAPQQAVLGLATTSGENPLKDSLISIFSLSSILLGFLLVRKNVQTNK